MFFHSWARLCSVRTRVVNGGKRWRTLFTGHTGETHTNIPGVRHWCTVTTKRLCHSDLGDLYKNESVERYLRTVMEECRHVSEKLELRHLSTSDRTTLQSRHAELQTVAYVFQTLEGALKEQEEVLSLIHSSAGSEDEDKQLTQLLMEEEAKISSRILALRKDLIKALVPTDPLDSSNVLLEVMAGRTTGGGLHHAAVRIAGENVYRYLKHEGGTHRVQRIPEVGLSSRMQRIHTGTMTVVVLPQPTELEVSISPKDLRVDTFRAQGAGGQSVNTTDSAVRIVHLPTGITAECQQSRSQQQNRNTAMRMLRARLHQSMMGKANEKRKTARKQQVGMRSQSDRIRTYNFSQDRVTDHRTGYEARDIKEFMRGGEGLGLLVSDVLEHSEREAVLDLAKSGGGGGGGGSLP
ncbi:peptide chain release factor 1, mitochondrial isoform 2-T2 [Aulostomus maculatus]